MKMTFFLMVIVALVGTGCESMNGTSSAPNNGTNPTDSARPVSPGQGATTVPPVGNTP